MKIRMWEAVAAPGRLAELEAAARALLTLARPGERVEAATDGESRIVVTTTADDPPAYDERIDPALFGRAHAWTFTQL